MAVGERAATGAVAALAGLPSLAWFAETETGCVRVIAVVERTLGSSVSAPPGWPVAAFAAARGSVRSACGLQQAAVAEIGRWAVQVAGVVVSRDPGGWAVRSAGLIMEEPGGGSSELVRIALKVCSCSRAIDPDVLAAGAARVAKTAGEVARAGAGAGPVDAGRARLVQAGAGLRQAAQACADGNRMLAIYVRVLVRDGVASYLSRTDGGVVSRPAVVGDPSGEGGVPSAPGDGVWAAPGRRSYGDPFNEVYEVFVQEYAAALSGHVHPPGMEYLIEAGGERRFLDAVLVRRGGETEVVVPIDAKGHYAQFIDPKTGRFKEFWTNLPGKGLQNEVDQARAQFNANGRRRVEWWCSERETVRLLNAAFARDAEIRGMVRARYVPIPEDL